MSISNNSKATEKKTWGNAVLSTLSRDAGHLKRDPALLMLLFIVPPVLFTLLCLIYSQGGVRDLPVAVCDLDRSSLSRQMVRAIDATASMKVIKQVRNIEEIKAGIRGATFVAAFYFPPGMETDVKTGKTVSPVIFKNSQNLMVGGSIYKESAAIFRTFNAGVLLKKLTLKGLPYQQAMAAINPVTVDSRILFNPNFNYEQFMCPGLIFAQFEAIIMMTALLFLTREYARDNMRQAYAVAQWKWSALLLGKSLLYGTIFMLLSVGIIGVLFPLFSMYLKCSFFTALSVVLLFVFASFSPGLLLGAVLKTPVFALTAAILINMPAFIFGGFVYPAGAMPGIIVAIAQLLPFTHFSSVFFKLCMMNLPIVSCGPELLKLGLFACLPLFAVAGIMHGQVKKISATESGL
jgi:ABC-2 type transport system permease protein